MQPPRRLEDTHIDQYMRARFDELGIPWVQTRRNAATARSGQLRGDIWVSRTTHDSPNFEAQIVALIECKDRSCQLGDRDWLDAIRQGREKATRQGLHSFFVTNTDGLTRCYNAITGAEITLDGRVIADFASVPVLIAVQAQVNAENNAVRVRSFAQVVPDANRFRSALWNLRQVFRSRGMGRGSEEAIIKTTLTFCILHILSERQRLHPVLPSTVLLWSDWRRGQIDRDVRNTIDDVVEVAMFQHLRGSLEVDGRLNADAVARIVDELGQFNLYGSDFDFFGIVYETYASRNIKKDFGEFYTPRHIVRFMVRNLFFLETSPRPIRICDLACGTGGFLVEAFLYLQETYRRGGSLTDDVSRRLKNSTFVGLDTNGQHAIPYARTNMMMAGDGGAHVRATADSLTEDLSDQFDYIIANVPYGQYAGAADISSFAYTNKRRYELLFLEKIVTSLLPGGKAAVIVPDGLVQNTSNDSYRLRFLFDVTVEAVVSLPSFSFLPYTGEKTYILFFTKKMPRDRGRLQEQPIWHYIVDHDGFQAGSKRFPINQDDLTSLEDGQFGRLLIDGKAKLVPIDEVCEANFFSLSSETYLRRKEVVEMSEVQFEQLLVFGERFLESAFDHA
ncbi:HsdM family class I SAM-dependent methyltransferase [Sphingomonas jeddahensis]|uniref:site-specific DNA-methyltransferase (adenine-specific) n=1 Tax=Sphingomonas jeddahensis TaxID=1915074 RepID=A0A1V2ETJ6_9SPHN|nr:N-6 DNA methylase [Sphingomonas jeddahensis]ONF95991.1 putative type I restriction enzymeP M protein [Sphingomonas jeddahensis]